MNQSQRPTLNPSADQLMRRMLNSVTVLQTTCKNDAEELRRIRDKREVDIRAVEQAARSRVDRDVGSAHELANTVALGSRLRAELSKLPLVEVCHMDPGAPPETFEEAVDEWHKLASSVEQRARDFRAAIGAWNSKLIKRTKSAPRISDDFWHELDRLDAIHRSMPSLQQAYIAGQIREVIGAADILSAAERDRQRAGQQHLADEVRSAVSSVESLVGLAGASWADKRWGSPVPTETTEHYLRLGDLQVDVPKTLDVPRIPALMAFPPTAGVAVGSEISRRREAVALLKALVLRLFVVAPPGNVHIKAVDPVSLGQSVAEFRHLSEYDSQLMDEKTWTSERDIERLMDDLSDHLEIVISRYLRGQFDTIDEYNHHAGEVAQPYRVLVIFDYPNGFSDRASRQLLSLIENGPRCGVYTILHYDQDGGTTNHRQEVTIDRLTHSMQKVLWSRDQACLELADPVGTVGLGLLPDEAPPISFDEDGQPETSFATLLPKVGIQVRKSHDRPAAVTLDSLLPVMNRSRSGVLPDFESDAGMFSTDSTTWWKAQTVSNTVAPLGRSGAQGVTSMYFSSTDIAGGAIMVGLPRSGKTTSLHAMILTMSMLYSPEELDLYLIDAKHGVEFKIYENLPHARMVSVHSEREFSLAVLKSIEAQIQQRAELMKKDGQGRANLTEYRTATGAQLARVIVIIDEFHEIFEEPDRIGQEAFAAFSNIVRMGPFSGVHIVVASQTLSSMPAMDRQTLMLLPQRVTFMCNEYDAEILMGDTNRAPRLLSKTGEGLFNPSRGEESKNQPFQGLYIDPDERSRILRQLQEKAADRGWQQRPRVFDGDAIVTRPAVPARQAPTSNRLSITLGEPFSLADQESIMLRRTRGANLLLLGDSDTEGDDDPAIRGALHSSLLSAKCQKVEIIVIDFIGDEATVNDFGVMELADALGATYVRSHGSGSTIGVLASEVTTRTTSGNYRAATKLLTIVGLQRALSLNPLDAYAYAESEQSSAASQLALIIRSGPEVGVHVLVSADRAKTIDRRLGGDLVQEFNLRVAGSTADKQDLSAAAGQYSDVAPLRYGQLLLGDLLGGTTKRIRGYGVVTETELTQLLKGLDNA